MTCVVLFHALVKVGVSSVRVLTLLQAELDREIEEAARTYAQMRQTADQLLELEEWLQAQSILESLLTIESEGSSGYRRVLRCDV
jgi:hypothetical protein